MEFKDYYKIMGVEETASQEEIKKAYRKLARRYHPDVSKEENAEQLFKDLGEAYEVLKDKDKRQEYDQLRKMGAMGNNGEFRPPPGWESATNFSDQGSGDFSDFFENIFGRSGGFHRSYAGGRTTGFDMRGEDIHTELSLFLEDVFAGTEKTLQLRIPVVDDHGMVTHQTRKLKVKIPAGTSEGQNLKLKGQGAPGIGKGPTGDLIISIRLAPHPLYTIQGKNISIVLPLTPWEAALGTKLTVPTPGGKIKLSVPAHTQSGARLRIKARGLPGKPPGDFFAVVKIVMPDRGSEKSDQLFSELSKELDFNPRQHWEE
ncbi:MAG: cytochrome C biogenesis protein [Gammaproteobacteria bacterium]|nr:cytochrome C biogenesis protein [Gammaproteobacteria bacterium]MAY03613.1 cytochrome C biogenesis protein [Gammaproteobacteria bacterium]|tara:strand:- start:400 stop:1347 length:948 start_codon:yes stop_codon:yes gene_type:complete